MATATAAAKPALKKPALKNIPKSVDGGATPRRRSSASSLPPRHDCHPGGIVVATSAAEGGVGRDSVREL